MEDEEELGDDGFDEHDEYMAVAFGQLPKSIKSHGSSSAVKDELANQVKKVGTLEVSVKYDSPRNQVQIKVIQTHELPRPGSFTFGGEEAKKLRWNSIQISLALLPSRKQRHKTEITNGDNPQFNAAFTFNNISSLDFNERAIRFRAYACERKRRKLLLAENVLALGTLPTPKNETTLNLPLELRAFRQERKRQMAGDASDEEGKEMTETQATFGVAGFPELFLGVAYNATTGQLAVEVIKGSSFMLPGMSRPPDTYIKVSMLSSTGLVMFKSKTESLDNSPNPMWKENFVFPVNKFQLNDITIMVVAYAKKTMNRREMIGWFSIGSNNSGEEELAHWQDAQESKGEQIKRWHRLLPAAE